MITKFSCVEKGYAELSFDVGNSSIMGIVRNERIVEHVDYDADEIHYAHRWFAYVHVGYSWKHFSSKDDSFSRQYQRVGRRTGYEKREEAIEALKDYVSINE